MRTIITFILLTMFSILASFEVPYTTEVTVEEGNTISSYTRISPDDGVQINLPTQVSIWQDGENIYFYWIATIDETASEPQFALADEWLNSDSFRVQLITSDVDNYSYYFYAFPGGNTNDGTRNSEMNLSANWDSSYSYTNEITENEWRCLFTIPVKDLRFPGKAPYQWRVILTRYIDSSGDYYQAPHTLVKNKNSYFKEALPITITTPLKKALGFEVSPYISFNGDILNKESEFDRDNVGIDFSFSPTNTMKLKATVNPEFSEVIPDQEQDNFNNKYAPYLEENRFFFIEDMDIFNLNDSDFYSRNILQPSFAAKLTNSSEKLTYGILSAKDKKVVENGEVINDDDLYNIIVLRPKWEHFYLNFAALRRSGNDVYNEKYAFKGLWELSPIQTVSTSATHSYFKHEGEKGFSDITSNLNYNIVLSDLKLAYNLDYVGEDFYSALGRVFDRGYYSQMINLDYNKDILKSIKSISSYLGASKQIKTSDKSWKVKSLWGNINFNFPNDSSFNINSSINYAMEDLFNEDNEVTGEKEFRQHSSSLNYNNWKYDIFSPWININYEQETLWKTYTTTHSVGMGTGFSSKIDPLTVSINYNWKKLYLSKLEKEQMDDIYALTNIDVSYYFTENMKLTGGIRHNNYFLNNYNGHIGTYLNYRWELNRTIFIYAGVSSSNDLITPEGEATPHWNDWHDWEPSQQTVYLKVKTTLK